MNRDRFPGLRDGWARLDGPAGTQMVDTAIDAMADFMRSGHIANQGGVFAAAQPRTSRSPTRAQRSGAPRRRPARRGVRPEHDRAHDALRRDGRARRLAPATSSSAPASTTTPTSAPG